MRLRLSPWRLPRLALALALASSLAGCDLEELDAFEDPNPFALRSCGALSGTFHAIDLRVTASDDPRTLRDFDSEGADWRVSFEGGMFVSRLTEPRRAPVVLTGQVEVVRGDLVLREAPLLPGVAFEGDVVGCSVIGPRVFLRGPARFDFDGDGVAEDAYFEADLDPE